MDEDTGKRCPQCGSELAAGAVVCIQCGYNLREGRALTSVQSEAEEAPQAAGRPASAVVATALAAGVAWQARIRERVRRQRWVLPALGAGVVLLLVIGLATWLWRGRQRSPGVAGPGSAAPAAVQGDPVAAAAPSPQGAATGGSGQAGEAPASAANRPAQPLPAEPFVEFPHPGRQLLFHEKIAALEAVAAKAPAAQLMGLLLGGGLGGEGLGCHEVYYQKLAREAVIRGARRFWPKDRPDDPESWKIGTPEGAVLLGPALAGMARERKDALLPVLKAGFPKAFAVPEPGRPGAAQDVAFERRFVATYLAEMASEGAAALLREWVNPLDTAELTVLLPDVAKAWREKPLYLVDLLEKVQDPYVRYEVVEALGSTGHPTVPKLADELYQRSVITPGMWLALKSSADLDAAEKQAIKLYWEGCWKEDRQDCHFMLRYLNSPAMDAVFEHATESPQGPRPKARPERGPLISRTTGFASAAPPAGALWTAGRARLVTQEALLGTEAARARLQRWIKALYPGELPRDDRAVFADPVWRNQNTMSLDWHYRPDAGMPFLGLVSPVHGLPIAVWKGDAAAVGEFLKDEACVRLAGPLALCYAVAKADRKLIDALLAAGVPANCVAVEPGCVAWSEDDPPALYFTPLLVAVEREDVATAEYLLGHGADLDFNPRPLGPVLHEIALRGSDAAFDFVLSHKANLNLRSNGAAPQTALQALFAQPQVLRAAEMAAGNRRQPRGRQRETAAEVAARAKAGAETWLRLHARAQRLLQAGADPKVNVSRPSLWEQARNLDALNAGQAKAAGGTVIPSFAELLAPYPPPDARPSNAPEDAILAALASGDPAAFRAVWATSPAYPDSRLSRVRDLWTKGQVALPMAMESLRLGGGFLLQLGSCRDWPEKDWKAYVDAQLAAGYGLGILEPLRLQGSPFLWVDSAETGLPDALVAYVRERVPHRVFLAAKPASLPMAKAARSADAMTVEVDIPPTVDTQEVTTESGRAPIAAPLWLDNRNVALLYDQGRIEVYDVATMKLVREGILEAKPAAWVLTKAGIVIALEAGGEVLVVAPATLSVVRKIPVEGVLTSLAGCAASPVLYALREAPAPKAPAPKAAVQKATTAKATAPAGPAVSAMVLVQTESGETAVLEPTYFSERLPAAAKLPPIRVIRDLAVTPDGGTLLLLAEQVHAFRTGRGSAYVGSADCALSAEVNGKNGLFAPAERADGSPKRHPTDTLQLSSDGAYFTCVPRRTPVQLEDVASVTAITTKPVDALRTRFTVRTVKIPTVAWLLQPIYATAALRPTLFTIPHVLAGGIGTAMGHGCGLTLVLSEHRDYRNLVYAATGTVAQSSARFGRNLDVYTAWGTLAQIVPLPPLSAELGSRGGKAMLPAVLASPDGKQFVVLFGNRLTRVTPTAAAAASVPGAFPVPAERRNGPWLLVSPPDRPRAPTDIVIPELAMTFIDVPGEPLWVGQHTVTRAQYNAYCKETGLPLLAGADGEPATGVDLASAVRFCSWLTLKVGKAGVLPPAVEVQLPTLDLWRFYASCRSSRAFPWGDLLPARGGNYAPEAGVPDPWPGVAPVAALPPNEWGLCGVGSNVMEWTTSLHHGGAPNAPHGGVLLAGAAYVGTPAAQHAVLLDERDAVAVRADEKPDKAGFRVLLAPGGEEWQAALKRVALWANDANIRK
jgi:formylglycine-generating enzyme required for sulfatase activity